MRRYKIIFFRWLLLYQRFPLLWHCTWAAEIVSKVSSYAFGCLFWELFSNFSGSKGWNTLALISFLQLPSTVLSPCISISVPNAKHVMKNNSYKNNSCSFIFTKIDFWIKNSTYSCHFLWRDDNVINKKYGIEKNFFWSVRPFSGYGFIISVVKGNSVSCL